MLLGASPRCAAAAAAARSDALDALLSAHETHAAIARACAAETLAEHVLLAFVGGHVENAAPRPAAFVHEWLDEHDGRTAAAWRDTALLLCVDAECLRVHARLWHIQNGKAAPKEEGLAAPVPERMRSHLAAAGALHADAAAFCAASAADAADAAAQWAAGSPLAARLAPAEAAPGLLGRAAARLAALRSALADVRVLDAAASRHARVLSARMQVLLPFWIEGASAIESPEADPRWAVYVALRRTPSACSRAVAAASDDTASDSCFETGPTASLHAGNTERPAVRPTQCSDLSDSAIFAPNSDNPVASAAPSGAESGTDIGCDAAESSAKRTRTAPETCDADCIQTHAAARHAVVAYCSAYDFMRFPQGTRRRISQFAVVPGAQRAGLGLALYAHVLAASHADVPDLAEVTVEDPAPAFCRLRLAGDALLCASRLLKTESAGDVEGNPKPPANCGTGDVANCSKGDVANCGTGDVANCSKGDVANCGKGDAKAKSGRSGRHRSAHAKVGREWRLAPLAHSAVRLLLRWWDVRRGAADARPDGPPDALALAAPLQPELDGYVARRHPYAVPPAGDPRRRAVLDELCAEAIAEMDAAAASLCRV